MTCEDRSSRPNPMRTLAVLLACLAATTVSAGTGVAQEAEPAGGSTVRGSVVDRITGAPLSGVAVRPEGAGTAFVTGDDGTFTIDVSTAEDVWLSFRRPGYVATEIDVAVDEAGGLAVGMVPEPHRLKELSVSYDRLDARLRASAHAAVAFERDELALSGASDPVEFVRRRYALPLVGCGMSLCVLWRGQEVAPRVTIDERPAVGGLQELESYPLDAIYRVEVLRGGRMIRAYTVHFMQRIARGGYVFPAIY